MKKIIALLFGIEMGILSWLLLSFTLVIYLVVGIISYLLPFIPVMAISIATMLVCITFFVIIALSLAERLHRFFLTIVLALPAFCLLLYVLFFRPPNKEKEINDELRRHHVVNSRIYRNYNLYSGQLAKQLVGYANNNFDGRGNLYMDLIGDLRSKPRAIEIDTLFISPAGNIGVALFSYQNDTLFDAVPLFFTIKSDSVYEIFPASLLPHGYGKSRAEALTDSKYNLYIVSKKGTFADYSPEYKKWEKYYPNILDTAYWRTTIKLDTLNMGLYGAIKANGTPITNNNRSLGADPK